MRAFLLVVTAAAVALLVSQLARRPFHSAEALPAGMQNLEQPGPLRIRVGGRERMVQLDALLRYGATAENILCRPQDGTTPDDWRRVACGGKAEQDDDEAQSRGDAAMLQAATILRQAEKRPLAEREPLVRDANGFVLLALRGDAFETRPVPPVHVYEDLADQSDDGRLHDIASELWLVTAAFCPDGERQCRLYNLRQSGRSLVNAGRWCNDTARLRLAAERLRDVLREQGNDIDPDERFSLANDIGNAFSYASAFAPAGERLPLIDQATAAYEAELAQAEAKAPSFDSGRLWQNLGAAYVDRGAISNSKNDFERGIAFYEKSLPLFDRSRFRQAWARAKSNLGAARSRMASTENDLALHDAGLRDQEESIAAFEEGQEKLDADYGRYRLAKSLDAKARSADALAKQLGDGEEGRRADLEKTAKLCRDEALKLLERAGEAFRRSGSRGYLAWVERLTAEIRSTTPGP